MSQGEPIPLEKMEAIAKRVFERLSLNPADCLVVGSVRRRKAMCRDLEIIAPHRSDGLCSMDTLYRAIKQMCDDKLWVAKRGLNPGFYYAGVMAPAFGSSVNIEFYRYDDGQDGNRGWIQMIRTGPADFGRAMLARWKRLGNPGSDDGYPINANGKKVAVPTEEMAFAACCQRFIAPEDRDKELDNVWPDHHAEGAPNDRRRESGQGDRGHSSDVDPG